MQTARIYGYSDDNVEVEGIKGGDEFGCFTEKDCTGRLIISTPNGERMQVSAIFDGCWAFAVGLHDEDDAFPSWPVRVSRSTETPYSMLLEIDVPDEAECRWLGTK